MFLFVCFVVAIVDVIIIIFGFCSFDFVLHELQEVHFRERDMPFISEIYYSLHG